jgi:NAD(P)-dependent dehydrogenase (short-subunit alcohol dehydrogenase family)
MSFVITGGAQGIGAATARMAASDGASVVLADIADDAGEALAAEITAAGGRALYCRCDLREDAEIAALMDTAARAFGGIDVLHNNAGIADAMLEPGATLESMSLETWDRVMAVNLRAPFVCARAALPHLRASAQASIINAGSIASWLARPHTIAYGASKGGVAMLTRQLALELAPDRIRVNAYGPGMVETEMAERYLAGSRDPGATRAAVLENYLVPQLGRPDDIAAVVCFLASPRSAFVNGVVWPVDGGFTAWKATPVEVRGAR